MRRALALASASIGQASPNPQVGCVLVREEEVIGEGAHFYDARDHAEVVALGQAALRGETTRGATAYVTLEPCSHQGRTGPCADALIAAGIARCVVATVDPNPQVRGRGIVKMRSAGIEVAVGPGEAEARELNNAFALSMLKGRPFVTLKAALSADGKLAPPSAQRVLRQPFWLTGLEARTDVQALRHGADAVLTGIGTVLADDPLLTDRTGLARRRPLLRVVLDSHLRMPLDAVLVQEAQDDLLIVTAEDQAQSPAIRELQSRGVQVIAVPSNGDGLSLTHVLANLHERKILSVLLEAGTALNGAFLRAQLVDQVVLFYAAIELGDGALEFAAGIEGPFALEQRLTRLRKESVGADVRVSGLLHDPWQDVPSLG